MCAFQNQETTLTLPNGATFGPRIVIDGDAGTITLYGNTDDDKIVLNPSGSLSIPVVNMQNSTTPGDTLTGLGYIPSLGPALIGDNFTNPETSSDVRARVQLIDIGGIKIGVQRTSDDLTDGGSATLGPLSASIGYFVNDLAAGGFLTISPSFGVSLSAEGSDNTAIGLAGRPRIEHADYIIVEDIEPTNDTQATSSFVAGTSNDVTFVAPRSGCVKLEWSGWLGSNSTVLNTKTYLSCEVRTGSTIGGGSVVTGYGALETRAVMVENFKTAAGFHYGYGTHRLHVFGLTVGNTYHARTMFKGSAATFTTAVKDRTLTVEPMLITNVEL